VFSEKRISDCSAQAERIRASDEESRGSARSADHAVELRDEALLTNPMHQRGSQRARIDGEYRRPT
jgi:hypothetical protein